ncbi:hypothetical protein SHO565_45530 [Streptomyces sp. HO565]
MTDGGVMDHEDMSVGEADREPDPSDSLRTFGAVMQALREHAGYSRTEFADLVSFSKHTVESVELGRRMPDLALVERSEEALGNTGALRKASKYVTRGRGPRGLVPAVGPAGAGGGEPVHVRVPAGAGVAAVGGVCAGGVRQRHSATVGRAVGGPGQGTS